MNSNAKPIIEEIRASVVRLKEENASLKERLQRREDRSKDEQAEAALNELKQRHERVLEENEGLKATNQSLIGELKQLKEMVEAPKGEVPSEPPTEEGIEPQQQKPSPIEPTSAESTSVESASVESTASDGDFAGSNSMEDDSEGSSSEVAEAPEAPFGEDPFANEDHMSDDDDFFKTIADK